MSRPRILHCITVYNGRAFVPSAIESALRIDQSEAEIDVLVLDDASPDPGWSSELEEFCRERGALYYLSPRNLGIPRNVNLGLLTAVELGYDYVVISNSDVLYPKDLMSSMLAVAKQDRVGSVTAWSNNVSIYSLPNTDPDRYLSKQPVVDWLHATLNGYFGNAAIDAPAGISFCILMHTDVVRTVGIMDPCFGRGYCEETDWSLRSLKAGYRICVAPGTFVYHKGRGSNLDAGLISGNLSTVPANEAIIDLRYPQFRTQVDAFANSGILPRAHEDAIKHIMCSAAKQFGYFMELGSMQTNCKDEREVRVILSPEAHSDDVVVSFCGFRCSLNVAGVDVINEIINYFGTHPKAVTLLDHGRLADRMKIEFRDVISESYAKYPRGI